MLALVRDAVRAGWQVLCFDLAPGQHTAEGWAGRDAGMAANLTEQQQRFCPDGKVLAVCGNRHSRMVLRSQPGDWTHDYWPSFAAAIQESNPDWSVRSVTMKFDRGTYYNVAVRRLSGSNRHETDEPVLGATPEGEHMLELHLPFCSAASFLAVPTPLPTSDGS